MATDLSYPPDASFFPALYITDKRGKERIWKIYTRGNTVHSTQGLVDGKKQTYERVFDAKNVGRSNETTAEEQALKEAQKKWISQIDKGYLPSDDDEVGQDYLSNLKKAQSKTGGHNINSVAALTGGQEKQIKGPSPFLVDEVTTVMIPMKAHIWKLEDTKDPKSVYPRVTKYFNFDGSRFKPCIFVQPKLDGFRCVARIQNGEVVLTTNNKKQYPWFEGLRTSIKTLLDGEEYIDGLDGELYTHQLYDADDNPLDSKSRFSMISSMCGIRNKEPHPQEDQLNFVVFDLVDMSGTIPQHERFKMLNKIFKKKLPNVIKCKTVKIKTLDDLIKRSSTFLEQGYEGTMIRAYDFCYSHGKRSQYIRKYKNFIDEEYIIVDAQKDSGVDDEYFVWICETKDNHGKKVQFKAKPQGSRLLRQEMYASRDDYIGRYLTVKYQELSDNGIPRFPVGVSIRDEF